MLARDADRTSRILASLMAAAQGPNNRTEAPANRQALNMTNLNNMVAAATGAMDAVAESDTPAGGPLAGNSNNGGMYYIRLVDVDGHGPCMLHVALNYLDAIIGGASLAAASGGHHSTKWSAGEEQVQPANCFGCAGGSCCSSWCTQT